MSRRPPPSSAEPTYDSFLDIVANLVGILVILIMVLGVRAKDAWEDTGDTVSPPVVSASLASPLQQASAVVRPVEEREKPSPDVETPRRKAAVIREQLFELDEQAKLLAQELAIQRRHRAHLQLQVRMAQQESEESEQQAKGEDIDSSTDLPAEIASAERDRQQLRQEIDGLEAATSAPTVLRNMPTPLARPVDGNEIHLRLLGGRVAYVPISEAVARLSQVAAKKVWRLKNSYEVKAQLEPRDGFVMHYTLVRQLQSGGRESPALGGFEMVPQSDQLGEEFAVAVAANSELAARLSDYDPHAATITVWTYPDSFSYFRDLKAYLLDRGFQVAARPLPSGYPIGGSPHGSRSAAQ